MSLREELDEIAAIAARHAAADEDLSGILATEPRPGERVYVCAFDGPSGRTWLALNGDGTAVADRERLRDAVSIAALCEVAEDSSGIARSSRVASPGYLDELGGASARVAAAVREGFGAVEELAREVEARYKITFGDS